MKSMAFSWKWVVVWVLLGILTGCACQKVKQIPGSLPGQERQAVKNPLVFPDSYRMVHRVRLEVRGRVFDFIGYLALQGSNCRAIGVSEIGGTMFDLLLANGQPVVLKNPGRIPSGSLKRGVLTELAWFFGHPESNPVGFKEMTLVVPAAHILQLVRQGCLFSVLTIHSFQTVEGWPHPIPSRFEIQNHHWGYRMQVELLRLDLRPVESSAFIVAREED